MPRAKTLSEGEIQELVGVRQSLSNAEEILDGILERDATEGGEEKENGDPAPCAAAAKLRLPRGRRTRVRPRVRHLVDADALRRQAEAGVGAVRTTAHDDGWLTVAIEAKEALLPPKLGEVFVELIRADGVSPDDKLPWKSIDHLRAVLPQVNGGPITPGALTQRVSRLRNELTDQGLNGFLVQNQLRVGYRFALRMTRVATLESARPRAAKTAADRGEKKAKRARGGVLPGSFPRKPAVVMVGRVAERGRRRAEGV
jgi:hypothetical protein